MSDERTNIADHGRTADETEDSVFGRAGSDSRAKGVSLPAGFRYQPELIGSADECALLTQVRALPFREFEFHGYLGKRKVVSFGWQYDYSGRELRQADDIPEFLLALRKHAALFANLAPEELQQVLVTEYGPGAGIGWHRDKPVFGEVVGISLLTPCLLRFRHQVGEKLKPGGQRSRQWERKNVTVERRSAYLLTGPARKVWQHSIPPVDALRYSITFRNVRTV
jgi:alkylated DNA repair dioxygenase AlkB